MSRSQCLLRIIALFQVINCSLEHTCRVSDSSGNHGYSDANILGTADVHCYPGNESVPLLSGCNNRVTIEGENVTFNCSFGDDYLPVDYHVFWRLTFENGSYIMIENDMNYTDFCLRTYQDCPNNSSCCRFTSELNIHTNLLMNNVAVSCNAIINKHTTSSTCHLSVVMRPTITVPLTNIRAEEGKTVNFECLVTAVTMSGWTLLVWKKNNIAVINPHKYKISKKINPYRNNKNSIKCILTINNISKEDEANYTLIVYYDEYVLKQYGITGDYFNQTTGSLLVDNDNKDSKDNKSLLIIVTSAAVAIAVLLVIILTTIVICARKRKPSSGRNAPGERTHLLESESHTQEYSPVPATSDTHYTTTVPPESQDGREERFHSGRHRDDDLQTDRPLNSPSHEAGNSKLINYRPHMQAIKDHVVCKVAHRALHLALEFGISEEEASDLAKNGEGQIKIFRIWLKKAPQTWKALLNSLRKLNEHKLADELRDKLENKVILSEMLAEKPSMYSLRDVIQRVAPYSRDIAIELGLNEYYQILETDHPTNCVLRCQKIFEKFLEGANPTWEEVIRSIRAVNFIVIANDIEKDLPEMLDEEEMRCVHVTLEHEPLKIDMLTLLLSTQSEINKIPLSDRSYGWLVDVQAVVKRISSFVQINDTELNMIRDPKLEPNHRSVCLARLIKDKGRSKDVYKMLRDLYCVTRTVQRNQRAAAMFDAPSSEPTSQPASVHNYYFCATPVPSAAATGSYSGLVPGIQAMQIAKSFDNPLCHKTIDFFQLVDTQTLVPHLYQEQLLTEDDFERIQLPNMTRSDRATFLYLKLVHLRREQFEVFMKCLRDAKEHMGHEELYHKLSTVQ